MTEDQGPSSHVWGLLGPTGCLSGPQVVGCLVFVSLGSVGAFGLEMLSTALSGFLSPVPGDARIPTDTEDALI